MGEVREQVTMKNVMDVGNFHLGHIREQDIRQATVPVLVDTGTRSVVLTEATCKRLGLEIQGRRLVTVAGGGRKERLLAGPVEIHWKERWTVCLPLVLPGESEDLLGVIPLEDMDLIVDPVNARLAGAHGDIWAKYIKKARQNI